MGYEINSTWTRFRQKDIERLNKIIDDEYCNEMEIGRKLNIMKKFEEKLKEAISKFQFETVIKFMREHNWTWNLYKDGKSYYDVPTKDDILEFIKDDLFKHGLYDIIENRRTSYGVSGGGLVFEMSMDGDYPYKDNIYVSIYFDISHTREDNSQEII